MVESLLCARYSAVYWQFRDELSIIGAFQGVKSGGKKIHKHGQYTRAIVHLLLSSVN